MMKHPNYVADGTPSSLVYVPCSESCVKMINENQESVNICPVVSVASKISRYFINMFYTHLWLHLKQPEWFLFVSSMVRLIKHLR